MRVTVPAALLCGLAALAPAAARAEPPAAAGAGWFVPPPPKPGVDGAHRSVDMREVSGRDEITVLGVRPAIQRDPRPQETHSFQPAHSDAASPDPRPVTPSGYCSSAYQTVAGQAATGADMVGMGSGHCN